MQTADNLRQNILVAIEESFVFIFMKQANSIHY